MHAQVSSGDSFCTFAFFDCFATEEEEIHAESGISNYATYRETTVHLQQPHLIEPMRLTVYEDLPATPRSATLSKPFFSRSGATSRASSRASLFTLRKRISKRQTVISNPVLQVNSRIDLPLRRRREFRPLELSIYVETNRLSNLPEFDRLSFTDFGELKNYDQILSRPQSAVLSVLQRTPLLALQDPPKSTSMYEIGAPGPTRPQTSYSVTSTSRPASEYDALHSHPVSWASLPGLSIITSNHKLDKSVAIMTPMEEEFSPDTTAVSVGDTLLPFPSDQDCSDAIIASHLESYVSITAPTPAISRGRDYDEYKSKSMDDLSKTLRPSRRLPHKQSISQWLATRQRTSSVSTVATSLTTASFAEHRRKRDEFYQLGQHAQVTAPHAIDVLDLSAQSDGVPYHRRTVTGSTIASTVDTDILSYDEKRSSSCTWTPTSGPLQSRSGTIKSVTSPGGRKVVTSTTTDMGVPTPMRGQVYIVDDEKPYLDDIRGPLRTPGIGVAF